VGFASKSPDERAALLAAETKAKLLALWQQTAAADPVLKEVAELQRAAQWRLDFVAAENSMGFHAPQELARVLAESIDLSRQGQLKAQAWKPSQAAPAEPVTPTDAAPATPTDAAPAAASAPPPAP
jgi:nitrite reductase (cytochrome c-552)